MFSILGLLTGLVDPISRIAGKIADARIASLKASTDTEKIKADERVKVLESRQAVMIAEAGIGGGRINAIMRAVLSIPAAWFLYEVIIFNVRDDISANMWGYVYGVLGFYFLTVLTAIVKR